VTVGSIFNPRRWQGRALLAILTAMTAFAGAGQALVPASASATLNDGGATCPNFLPKEVCAALKEGGGGSSDPPMVPNSDGGLIVIEEEAPYDPGGRSLGTPPSGSVGADGRTAQRPGRPAGGRRPAKQPPPQARAPMNWDRMSRAAKWRACQTLELAITRLDQEEWSLAQGGKAEELVYVPAPNGESGGGRWAWRPFKNLAELMQRRKELKGEWTHKHCRDWLPKRLWDDETV